MLQVKGVPQNGGEQKGWGTGSREIREINKWGMVAGVPGVVQLQERKGESQVKREEAESTVVPKVHVEVKNTACSVASTNLEKN